MHHLKYNSVHTEKWKPKTDPRYITFPKHAWQDTLHLHVHNAIYKLIVHFTQRIQYMQYSKGNSYLPDCGGYAFFSKLLQRWRWMPPPSIASKCFFSLCFCSACARCPRPPGETHTHLRAPWSHLSSTLFFSALFTVLLAAIPISLG